MRRCKMAIEGLLIGPYFFNVDEAGVENIFSIAVLDAAFFRVAGISHKLHDWSSGIQI